MTARPTRRPYTRVYPYSWQNDGEEPIPGIVFRNGAHMSLHVTPDEAYELANLITDMAERLEAGEAPICSPTTSEAGDAHQVIVPARVRHSLPLVAADGDPEQPLPANTADNE